MERQLVPFFGAKILSEIRPADVEAYRGQRMKRDGNPASIQTVNNDHTVLKHCLNVAVRRGLLENNAAARVSMPNPQNERDRVLTEEEWDRLYACSEAAPSTGLARLPTSSDSGSGRCRVDVGSGGPEARIYHATSTRYQDKDRTASANDTRCQERPCNDWRK